MNDKETLPTTLDTYLWPIIVIGMLSSVILACAYTIVLASKTPAIMMEESPYEKGLVFQEKITQKARGSENKLLDNYSITKIRGNFYKLKLKLKSEAVENIDEIKVELIRPADSTLDKIIAFRQISKAIIEKELVLEAQGLWFLEVTIKDNYGKTSRYSFKHSIN